MGERRKEAGCGSQGLLRGPTGPLATPTSLSQPPPWRQEGWPSHPRGKQLPCPRLHVQGRLRTNISFQASDFPTENGESMLGDARRKGSQGCCCWTGGEGAASAQGNNLSMAGGESQSGREGLLRAEALCPASFPLLRPPLVPPGSSLQSQAMWAGWAWGWPPASSQQPLPGGSWNHPESSSLLWLTGWPLTLTLSQLMPSSRRGQSTASDVSGPPHPQPSPGHLDVPRLSLPGKGAKRG